MAQASTSSLGPWVRLEGMSITQFPTGGRGIPPGNTPDIDVNSSQTPATTSELSDFVAQVLGESIPFIDSVAPKSRGTSSWKAKGAPKHFPSSDAPVHLYGRTVAGQDLDQIEGMSRLFSDRKDETWVCRKSCHEDNAKKGTASWDEFVRCFKGQHAESEMAFTPTVIGARKGIEWPILTNDIDIHDEKWTDIHVAVEEMKHKINPKPLKNRTFPVLQVSATLKDSREFLVVSIPVNDFEQSPYAEYSKDESLVVGAYTAIERVRTLPENGDIEWIMATSSNAKGVLPIWMQNLAVPNAVAKDVDFFMSWISTQRDESNKPRLTMESAGLEQAKPKATDRAQTGPPQISKIEPMPGLELQTANDEAPSRLSEARPADSKDPAILAPAMPPTG